MKKAYRFILCLLFLITLYQTSFNQKKIDLLRPNDSLEKIIELKTDAQHVNSLLRLSHLYFSSDPKLALELGQKAL